MGSAALQLAGSSHTRARTHVPGLVGRFLTAGPAGKSGEEVSEGKRDLETCRPRRRKAGLTPASGTLRGSEETGSKEVCEEERGCEERNSEERGCEERGCEERGSEEERNSEERGCE